MNHQEFSQKLMELAQQVEGFDHLNVETIIGGFAMTTAIMMDDVGIENINIGPHTISITTEQ